MTVRNAAALRVAAGAVWSAAHGVIILSSGDLTLGGATTVSGKYLRLDLVGARLLGGQSLTANGVAVYATSALAGNAATIDVGVGSFTWVIDNRGTTTATLVTNSSSFVAPVVPAVAGLTVTGTGNLSGLGAVYADSGAARGLRRGNRRGQQPALYRGHWDRGDWGCQCLFGFVAAGGERVGDQGRAQYGGVCGGCGLTAGAVGDGSSDLILSHLSDSSGLGLLVTDGLSAGRDLVITSEGNNNSTRIIIQRATLTAGRDLTILSHGRFGTAIGVHGIKLISSTLSAGGVLSLIQTAPVIAGTSGIGLQNQNNIGLTLAANQGVLVRTGQANLELSVSGGATVAVSITTPRLTIELGSGAITSSSAGGFVLAAPGTLLNALGAVVVMSGAVTGHNGRIAVGSGSFTWVNDLRTKTSPTLLDNNSTAADWGTGLGTLTSGTRSASGLTIIGTNINNQSVIYGGAVTIDGISTGAARELSNIEATSITVSGGASSFTAGLSLRTTGAMILAANLSAGGAIALHANSLTLSSNTTTAGGAVTIDLGQTGVYTNGTGAGFTLATSGSDLAIHAGSISNLTATNAIFRLGSGVLTASGGLAIATRIRTANRPSYSGGYITSEADELKFTSQSVAYYFTSDSGSLLAADQAAVKDSFAFWLNATALTAADLGFKSEGGTTDTYSSSGLNDGVAGDYLWRRPGCRHQQPDQKDPLHPCRGSCGAFLRVSQPDPAIYPPLWLSRSSSLSFGGANVFEAGLTLASAGRSPRSPIPS